MQLVVHMHMCMFICIIQRIDINVKLTTLKISKLYSSILNHSQPEITSKIETEIFKEPDVKSTVSSSSVLQLSINFNL